MKKRVLATTLGVLMVAGVVVTGSVTANAEGYADENGNWIVTTTVDTPPDTSNLNQGYLGTDKNGEDVYVYYETQAEYDAQRQAYENSRAQMEADWAAEREAQALYAQGLIDIDGNPTAAALEIQAATGAQVQVQAAEAQAAAQAQAQATEAQAQVQAQTEKNTASKKESTNKDNSSSETKKSENTKKPANTGANSSDKTVKQATVDPEKTAELKDSVTAKKDELLQASANTANDESVLVNDSTDIIADTNAPIIAAAPEWIQKAPECFQNMYVFFYNFFTGK